MKTKMERVHEKEKVNFTNETSWLNALSRCAAVTHEVDGGFETNPVPWGYVDHRTASVGQAECLKISTVLGKRFGSKKDPNVKVYLQLLGRWSCYAG